MGALIPVMIVLMLAGVPASGGGLSIYMVPELFRDLGQVLPLPAAVDIARSVIYFDGAGVGGNVVVLAIWGAVALALNVLLVDRGSTGRAPSRTLRWGRSIVPSLARRHRSAMLMSRRRSAARPECRVPT